MLVIERQASRFGFSKQNKKKQCAVGIEPNENFDSFIVDELSRSELNFEFEVKHGFAEQLDEFDDESIDTVISTHVLCSVERVDDALAEILRVLKPGGKFLFMEHVATHDATWTTTVQRNIRPLWRVLGDGCEFRDIATALRQSFGDAATLHIDEFDAPMPRLLAFVRPHVKGVATKL
jgi:ubiquinone/menaquinone biosynthesis C-methylase UbiE